MLETKSLLLRPAHPDLAEEAAAYFLRNRDFLTPFEPVRPKDFYTPEYQRSVLAEDLEKARRGEAFRFYISPKEDPAKIIGSIGLSNIIRGCFHSCFLGYRLDCQFLNRGYMTEAVVACTRFAFLELELHRVEANVMPRNLASLRVLQKAGYREEGRASGYLKINGVWEDHIHMVRLNDRPV